MPEPFPEGQVHRDNIYFGPPVCPADLDQDGEVEFDDFVMLLANWGVCPAGGMGGCNADLDQDGEVEFDDFTALLAAWGPCF